MLYKSLRQIKISLHFNVFFFQTSNQSDWIPPEIQSPISQSNADVNARGGIIAEKAARDANRTLAKKAKEANPMFRQIPESLTRK